MDDRSSLRCQGCDSFGIVMYTDEIPCVCGEMVHVNYVSCSCGFSWREANGLYIDGGKFSQEEVLELLSELENVFESEGAISNDTPMGELIHKCIRCGAVAAQVKTGVYECTSCDFSWEVDKFNE